MTRRSVLLFAFLGIAWGIPYLLIRVAVSEIEPAFLVLARTGLAALILLPITIVRRSFRPTLRLWKPLLAYAAAEVAAPWFFLASAERSLPSSTAGLLLAAVPLVGVGVGLAFGSGQKFSRANIIGLITGVLGVSLLVGFEGGESNPSALVQAAIVVVGYATGPAILARWMPRADPMALTALALGSVAVAYFPIVMATRAWPTEALSGPATISIVVLAVICSAGAFVALAMLVRDVGAVRATTVTYVNPAIALLAGAIVLHEPVTPWSVVGLALILVGCLLATRTIRRRFTSSSVTPTDTVPVTKDSTVAATRSDPA